MNTLTELKKQALALPVESRAHLAQELWKSIGEKDLDLLAEDAAVDEAIKRDREISEGKLTCKSRDEVMTALRQELGCSQ